MPFLIPVAAEAATAIGTASAATSAAVAAGSFGAEAAAAATLIPSIGTAASIGSSLIGGLGALSQSRSAAAAAGYNAKVAQQNAQIATQNAQFTGAEGEQNVAAAGAQTKAKVAATLANEAASGVDVNSGSAVNVRESEAKLGMLNALNVRSSAARQAYGFQTQSVSDNAQAELLRKQKVSDEVGGYLDAGATVLGGVGKASQYSTWLRNGRF